MRVFNVTFDVWDAVVQAGFWSAVVDRPVAEGAVEQFVRVPGDEANPNLLFIQVPEDRTAKNRVHIDLDAPDLAAARERLEGLGAEFVHEKDEYGIRWFTFRDPEGNEFCVGAHE